MKCKKCEYEIETEVNFCPNCGAKLNEELENETEIIKQQSGETPDIKQNILMEKPEKQDENQTVILTNPKLNILNAVVQFIFYFFLGMTIVTLAIGCKGFGLLQREIKSAPVWASFAVSLVGTIICGIIYYVKFMREK